MKRDVTPSIVDLAFMEARACLLDIAAFLDRVDRHGEAGDFRVEALKAAVPVLLSGEGSRAARILEQLSDPTTEPIPAAHTQGACGAPSSP